jgi:nickel-dependent lactate racemase
MNAKEQRAFGKLNERYVTELKMLNNAKIYGVMRKVLQAKTQADKIYALEFLLNTILDGQKEFQAMRDELLTWNKA